MANTATQNVIGGLIVIFLMTSTGTIILRETLDTPDYDVCRAGAIYGTWEPIGDIIEVSDFAPNLGKYRCEAENKELWCRKTTATRCYFLDVINPSNFEFNSNGKIGHCAPDYRDTPNADGTRTRIYSPIPIYADRQCNLAADFASLKDVQYADSYKPKVTKEDPNYVVKDIQDWNSTSMNVCVGAGTDKVNKEIPIRSFIKGDEKAIKKQFSTNLKDTQESLCYDVPIDFDTMVKIGDNSTEVTVLHETQSGYIYNTDCADSGTSSATNNYIYTGILAIGTGREFRGFYNFDTSGIPGEVISAELVYELDQNTLAAGTAVHYYNCSFDTTLTTADWGTPLGDDLGYILDSSTSTGVQYTFAIDPSYIHQDGLSQFCARTNQTCEASAYNSRVISSYTLNVTYTLNYPVITQTFPLWEYETTDPDITFNYTVTDPEDDTTTVKLYIDGTVNITNSSVASGTTFTPTITFAEGSHTWMVSATDGTHETNTTSWGFTYTTDTADPVVGLESPADASSVYADPDTLMGSITFICNATDNYDIENLTLYHNIGGSFTANYTVNYFETSALQEYYDAESSTTSSFPDTPQTGAPVIKHNPGSSTKYGLQRFDGKFFYPDVTVINATQIVVVSSNALDAGECMDITTYWVYNDIYGVTWTIADLTWNNQPQAGEYDTTDYNEWTICDGETGTFNINITPAMQNLSEELQEWVQLFSIADNAVGGVGTTDDVGYSFGTSKLLVYYVDPTPTYAYLEYTIDNVPIGTYTWNCMAEDSSGHDDWSANQTVEIKTPYEIKIINGSDANPIITEAGQNIVVGFNYTAAGNNINDNVTMIWDESILIGGDACEIPRQSQGTLDCSPLEEAECGGCGQCAWNSAYCGGTPDACTTFADNQTLCEAATCTFGGEACSGTPYNCSDYATESTCGYDSACNWTGQSNYCYGTPDACTVHTNETSCGWDSGCSWSGGGSETTQIDFEDFEGYSEGTQPDPIGNWDQAETSGTNPTDTDDWYVYTGNGESSGTGPTANYAGYYAMVETSSGACTNPDTAVLYLTPDINFDLYDYINVSFAYNMYGSTMGTLSVSVYYSSSWHEIWSLSGNQGTSWGTASPGTASATGTGRVMIKMACGASYTSDAAVDSVNVTGTSSGGCSGTPDPCGTYNASQSDCEQLSCTWGIEPTGGEPDYTEWTCDDTWSADCTSLAIDDTQDTCSPDAGAEENIDNVVLNSTIILVGDSIEWECCTSATVYSTDDMQWAYKPPGGSWSQEFTRTTAPSGNTCYAQTFTPDEVVGEHWFRCSITDMDYGGTLGTCVGGSYYDNDDANLTVINQTIPDSGECTGDTPTTCDSWSNESVCTQTNCSWSSTSCTGDPQGCGNYTYGVNCTTFGCTDQAGSCGNSGSCTGLTEGQVQACENASCTYDIYTLEWNATGNEYWTVNCTVPGSCSASGTSLFVNATYTTPDPEISVSDTANSGINCLGANPSLNLSFGPDSTTVFRFATCGPDFENATATPEGQNSTRGIDYLCNDGDSAGDVCVYLSGALNTGWTIFASNTSVDSNLIELNTTCKPIYQDLAADACFYAWYTANCSYVTQGPGAYEIYNITP